MNLVVVVDEGVFEKTRPQSVELCKTFANEPVELGKVLLLRTNFDNHGWQFRFLASRQIDPKQLVHRFFGVDGRHDREVDCSSQVDQVGIGLVLDLHGLLLFIVFFLGALIVFVIIVLVITALAKDLGFELLVGLLVLFPLRVILEDVQTVLDVNLAVEVDAVRDLILLLHQVELVLDGWVVLEAVLAHLEEHLNHVLHTLVDVCLVQDVPQLVPHGQRNSWLHFLEMLPHLAHEVDGNLHTVVGRLVQQQQEHLAGEHLVGDLLVDEVREEGRAGHADGLVATLEALAEGHDEALDEKLADGRQLGVDNGGHGGEHGREGQRRRLRLHHAAAEQAAALDEVLAKELGDNVLDVRVVDLVDQAVDGLLQGLPHEALVFLARLVGNLGLQSAESGRRDVCAAGSHRQEFFVFGLGYRLLLLLGLDGRRCALSGRGSVLVAAITGTAFVAFEGAVAIAIAPRGSWCSRRRALGASIAR